MVMVQKHWCDANAAAVVRRERIISIVQYRLRMRGYNDPRTTHAGIRRDFPSTTQYNTVLYAYKIWWDSDHQGRSACLPEIIIWLFKWYGDAVGGGCLQGILRGMTSKSCLFSLLSSHEAWENSGMVEGYARSNQVFAMCCFDAVPPNLTPRRLPHTPALRLQQKRSVSVGRWGGDLPLVTMTQQARRWLEYFLHYYTMHPSSIPFSRPSEKLRAVLQCRCKWIHVYVIGEEPESKGKSCPSGNGATAGPSAEELNRKCAYCWHGTQRAAQKNWKQQRQQHLPASHRHWSTVQNAQDITYCCCVCRVDNKITWETTENNNYGHHHRFLGQRRHEKAEKHAAKGYIRRQEVNCDDYPSTTNRHFLQQIIRSCLLKTPTYIIDIHISRRKKRANNIVVLRSTSSRS